MISRKHTISFYLGLIFIMAVAIRFLYFPTNILAYDSSVNCKDRYVTLINPVRSRNLWLDETLKPIKDQYGLIKQNDFAATWLLQDDVFFDLELINEIKQFDNKQEKGLFLEVSQNLADKSEVIYPQDTPWYKPQAIFLSGYSQSDRRKLIDQMFTDYKSIFGYYPKSVGAWWIDSYSLNYLRQKYNIKTALIVADQKLTDNYGIWGQWWGIPYYPSKANILTPASDLQNKLDVVILQWAQRDGLSSEGTESWRSNYSL